MPINRSYLLNYIFSYLQAAEASVNIKAGK
jgi:hypothetical protein